MTSLHSHIPLEDVKKSEELKNCFGGDTFYYEINKKTNKAEIVYADGSPDKDGCYYIPAPTIADVINNAESLFEAEMRSLPNGKIILKWQLCSLDILNMCQQNKPIQEISSYILTNIKKK